MAKKIEKEAPKMSEKEHLKVMGKKKPKKPSVKK